MLPAIMAGIGAVQTISGLIGASNARQRQKSLLMRRQAYKTPLEINQVLQATQQNASLGLNQSTLDYLTKTADASFASSLDVVQRVGGDPNLMSALFGNRVDAMGKVVELDAEQKMKNFSLYLDSLNSVAANKTAEWKSQQDMIKDELQAAAVDATTANQNISGGINAITGALSSNQVMGLFKEPAARVS